MHKFTLEDGGGSKQVFELNTFCVTTVANQVLFKAQRNEQRIEPEMVSTFYIVASFAGNKVLHIYCLNFDNTSNISLYCFLIV